MSRVVLLFVLLIVSFFASAQKECASTTYQDELLKLQPSAKQNMEAAGSFLNTSMRGESIMSGPGTSPSDIPVITIPVVIHLLYKDAGENISDEQIMSQIDVLNKAFQFQHADTGKIPEHFRSLAANCRIQFCLAKVDPKGYATNGIIRKSTWVTLYGIDDRIKFSDRGGDDAWPRDKYLNIWIGTLAGGLVGYASPVGGPANTDGIVVYSRAFGAKGTAAFPYHLGKTLVHEVGHWLGLRHIWGDASCGDDLVDDTPQQRTANRGCPSGIKKSCGTSAYGDMYVNYMDLSSDDCLLMFTYGQMSRMRSAFAAGGPRHALLSSNACNATPLPVPAEVIEAPVEVKVIGLYPNPAISRLVVDLKENADLVGAEAIVVNQMGQPVKRIRLTQVKTTVEIAALQSGMYMVTINGAGKKYQEKFMKL